MIWTSHCRLHGFLCNTNLCFYTVLRGLKYRSHISSCWHFSIWSDWSNEEDVNWTSSVPRGWLYVRKLIKENWIAQIMSPSSHFLMNSILPQKRQHVQFNFHFVLTYRERISVSSCYFKLVLQYIARLPSESALCLYFFPHI